MKPVKPSPNPSFDASLSLTPETSKMQKTEHLLGIIKLSLLGGTCVTDAPGEPAPGYLF